MALGDAMSSMRAGLQAALDELASPRSSSKSKHKALQSIERSLATALFDTHNDSAAKDCFVALQYTFECNVPSHLLSWIMKTTARLEEITNRGSMDVEQGSEAEELAAQLALALSLIQGIVLNHEASKVYLGRKPALETLLDLLLASRHLSSPQEASESKSKSTSSSPPNLTSIILDTLLCVLVDSPVALRTFEEASGVQGVVKILKRAGTPREVRMKCLEFLYFYLLDETPTSPTAQTPTDAASERIVTQSTPPSTAPATPIRAPKPYLSNGPKHPTSRYGSSTYLFASRSDSSGSLSLSASSAPSSRSTSGSSTKSFSSTSSNASSPTPASSISSSPAKESPMKESPLSAGAERKALGKRLATPSNQAHRTPSSSGPASPPFAHAARFPQMRTLMMLRKDVEYVPQSPKKPPPPTAGPPLAGLERRPTHHKSVSSSSSGSLIPRTSALGHARVRSQAATLVGSPTEEMNSPSREEGREREGEGSPLKTTQGGRRGPEASRWKTTEEKKELLGTMLGNVDALVEGVRKAGIWGLG